MKRRLTTTILALLLCVCTVFGFVGCSHAKKDEVNDKIASVNEQITAINKSIDDLKATDTALDGYIKALQASVTELETELDATNTKLAELEQNKNDSTYVTVTQLEEAKTALQGQIDATNTAIEALKSSDKTQNDKISALEGAKTAIEGQITAIDNRLKIVENAATSGGNCLCDNSLYATKAELTEAKTALEGQLATINSTLTELKTADTNLSNSLSALEAELKKADSDNKTALEASLAELKTALEKADSTNKTEIEGKIAALKTELSKADTDNKTELEGKITALESKVTASITANANAISTLETTVGKINSELETVKTTIATVKADLEKAVADLKTELTTEKSNTATEIAKLKASIASLESKDTELGNKITALETTVKTLADKDWVNVTFATLDQYKEVQTAISAINTEIANLKNSVASKTELKTAISDSEASMKTWVSGEFTEFAKGYYTIAQIDAMITQLRSEAYDDSGIKQDLADQKKALENAKADIKTAYEKAISDAITDNNGEIDTKISKAIEDANATLTSDISVIKNRLATIENDIAALKSDLSAVTGRVNTIEEQIEAINTSIASLETVDNELKSYIETLQNKVKTLEENSGTKAEIKALQDLITSLQEKDSALEERITDLKKYVDDELASNKDWANTTFATLEKLASTNNEIASIKTAIAGLASSDDLNSAISTSKDSMKNWVNEEFAKGYYTIAEIDAKLQALSSSAYDDTQIRADIEAQQTALENAKTELTNAYKQAIDEAIEKNNGEINTKIANDIKAAKEELEAKITAIEGRVTALEGKVEQHDKDIQDLLDKITKLQNQINCMNGIHEASEDDGDCTTAVTCKHCTTVVTEARSAHEASEDDGDCTTDIICKHCEQVVVAGNENHSPNADDNNCKTPIVCSICGKTTTEAKEHDFTGEWQKVADGHYHICQNDGCTAEDTKVGHTFGEDHKCSVCGLEISNTIDATNMPSEELRSAFVLALLARHTDITVTLTAEPAVEMFTAIRRALVDTESVVDGSINLTLAGVTVIPDHSSGSYDYSPIFGTLYADEDGEYFDDSEDVLELNSVYLPDALAVGKNAFYGCEKLTSIYAPKVQTLGSSAFGYTALTSVEFPELKAIPATLFAGTLTLTSAKFPKVMSMEGLGLLIEGGFDPKSFLLELTAEGDIAFNGINHFNVLSQNYSTKVDLVLNVDKKENVTFNDDGTATWKVRDDLSYTFKSITFVGEETE